MEDSWPDPCQRRPFLDSHVGIAFDIDQGPFFAGIAFISVARLADDQAQEAAGKDAAASLAMFDCEVDRQVFDLAERFLPGYGS